MREGGEGDEGDEGERVRERERGARVRGRGEGALLSFFQMLFECPNPYRLRKGCIVILCHTSSESTHGHQW